MKTAQEAFEMIRLTADEKAVSEIRFIKKMEIGQVVRQGDIYIHCVGDKHPHGDKTNNRQLAPGSTQGSRHTVEGNVDVFNGTTAPEWASRALIGPYIYGKERFVVPHPEHAHVSLPSNGYQITYQLDAQTMMRVDD